MRLSLNPDPHMAWIYDQSHPDYYSERAKDLRERRAAALRSAPQWMKDAAYCNDQEDAAIRAQEEAP